MGGKHLLFSLAAENHHLCVSDGFIKIDIFPLTVATIGRRPSASFKGKHTFLFTPACFCLFHWRRIFDVRLCFLKVLQFDGNGTRQLVYNYNTEYVACCDNYKVALSVLVWAGIINIGFLKMWKCGRFSSGSWSWGADPTLVASCCSGWWCPFDFLVLFSSFIGVRCSKY